MSQVVCLEKDLVKVLYSGLSSGYHVGFKKLLLDISSFTRNND